MLPTTAKTIEETGWWRAAGAPTGQIRVNLYAIAL
jgi:hypothetical protein